MLNERYDGTIIDDSKAGLARELARMNLTLNSYTQWYWKTDLLNLLNFLFLRADSHAQYEIRVYADIMLDTLKRWVPITFDAFMDLMETSMGVEDGLGNDERVRGNEQDEKKSWSDARKRVDVNALFRN